jgi:excisionase family DNA binding protein
LRLLSIKEAAVVLGLKPSTLYTWHSRGTLPLPCIKLGGKLLFDECDLDKLVESRKEKPSNDPWGLWERK